MKKVSAHLLKVGDQIMPPEREVRLWMRRTLQERNLPESALHMTITEIREGNPDKKGQWLIVIADQNPAWFLEGSKCAPFRFKVRPETPWQIVS